MKALLLAAGYGTRLEPYTKTTPKPLFTIAGRPVIDRLIHRLAAAGCRAVVVNTHHLADRMRDHLTGRAYPIPVDIHYEPDILGTGGAIANVAALAGGDPFWVVNGDIVTDVDFANVAAFHRSHPDPVTLVLVDVPELNSVSVSSDGTVTGFDPADAAGAAYGRRMTFTGIQVLDPDVLPRFPSGVFSSSIDTYRRLLAEGRRIRAYQPAGVYWNDIGTPERYRRAAIDQMAPEAFARACSEAVHGPVECRPLPGDGSDRRWYRLTCRDRRVILVDHGIRTGAGRGEIDAFVDIGRHLHKRGVPVPDLYLWDRFAGLVFLEDLGDRHLHQAAAETATDDALIDLYRTVITAHRHMALAGADGFDPGWTWQTPVYDRQLVLEKECRYFMEAFVNGVLGLGATFDGLRSDFDELAARASAAEPAGFLHRDLQSRNIMIQDGRIVFIDFQAGRRGPFAYDLASLLIDPYVALPAPIRHRLLDIAVAGLAGDVPIDERRFRADVAYCALARNLQILGAFGFLSRIKGKMFFSRFIPRAVDTLGDTLADLPGGRFPKLRRLYDKIRSSGDYF